MRYASAARALICSLSSTRATGWPLGVSLFECGVAPEVRPSEDRGRPKDRKRSGARSNGGPALKGRAIRPPAASSLHVGEGGRETIYHFGALGRRISLPGLHSHDPIGRTAVGLCSRLAKRASKRTGGCQPAGSGASRSRSTRRADPTPLSGRRSTRSRRYLPGHSFRPQQNTASPLNFSLA